MPKRNYDPDKDQITGQALKEYKKFKKRLDLEWSEMEIIDNLFGKKEG